MRENSYSRGGCAQNLQNLQKEVLEVLEALAFCKYPRISNRSTKVHAFTNKTLSRSKNGDRNGINDTVIRGLIGWVLSILDKPSRRLVGANALAANPDEIYGSPAFASAGVKIWNNA
jgi:hypothetical protein